jgi:hypothetical protein
LKILEIKSRWVEANAAHVQLLPPDQLDVVGERQGDKYVCAGNAALATPAAARVSRAGFTPR